ncbi:TldD/PmbA family protein [Archaeoglobus neptunius]|uniref:TldD/PmbA family protein n=1 Tax=Archaeoglobus neptunius TaxID=2798580 RepID=UPI00192526FA|nr:TldD/PmbA family protein [Archaeoglobus neptunius]
MDWEVYHYRTRGISAEIEAGKLKVIESYAESGFAARVIVKGRVGFASSASREEAIKMAEKIAKISEDVLDDFPSGRFRRVEGIYDRRVEDIDSNFLKEEYERLVSSISRAKISSAKIAHEIEEVEIENSYGLECYEKSTISSMLVETVHDGGSGYEVCDSRTAELEIEETARRAEELALESSRARKIESSVYDIVLEPIAVHQLFFYSLYPSFSAENVEKGRSRVRIGDKYGEITIIDDPTVRGGLASCSFDDEGVNTVPTTLMENGVVRGYYSDWKHSKKYGITANGFRMENTGYPSPMPSNIVVKADDTDESEKCIIIHSLIGSHTANPISGDFSLEVMNANYRGSAVKGMMIYGNIFDMLKRLEGELGEVRQIENTITKSLKFGKIRII